MALIGRLDHLVLTTRNLSKCIDFYTRVLGLHLVRFGAGGSTDDDDEDRRRVAFKFGEQKINVHELDVDDRILPKASAPTSGSLDLCFIAAFPLSSVVKRLGELGVDIVEGPVARTGAHFPITSVYVRDPDGNLIEIAERRYSD